MSSALEDRQDHDDPAKSQGDVARVEGPGRHVQPHGRDHGQGAEYDQGEQPTLTDPKLYDGSAAKPIKKLPNSEPAKEPA